MNNDNPAARLLAVLEKGKQISPGQPCRQSWQNLLKVSNGENALLMSRIGKVMELPEQIILALKDGFPNQGDTWTHWANQVNTAFMVQNINANWDSFINHVDVHTITYLRMAADLLQTKANTKLIADNEIQGVREKINAIYEEILNSELPDEIKKYLIRYLRKIQTGIDEYYLTGAIPLLEAMETMVGHTMVDKDYREFLRDTDLGKKILDTLSSMANVVTVAVGIPQLSQAIALLSN